jgi:hypothetical protein
MLSALHFIAQVTPYFKARGLVPENIGPTTDVSKKWKRKKE